MKHMVMIHQMKSEVLMTVVAVIRGCGEIFDHYVCVKFITVYHSHSYNHDEWFDSLSTKVCYSVAFYVHL